jgi:tRNA threonylcarbamoyladenosine biosynthesis protein TsaE
MEYVANDLAELRAIAQTVLEQLPAETALLLSQALAELLGVTVPVTSPTFTIVGEYAVPNHPIIKRLIHVDLYRLADDQAASDPSLQEVIGQADQPEVLLVIEWPEKLGTQLPKPAQRISFMMGDKPTQRVVRVD